MDAIIRFFVALQSKVAGDMLQTRIIAHFWDDLIQKNSVCYALDGIDLPSLTDAIKRYCNANDKKKSVCDQPDSGPSSSQGPSNSDVKQEDPSDDEGDNGSGGGDNGVTAGGKKRYRSRSLNMLVDFTLGVQERVVTMV